jgi:hypothetical protein
MAKISVAGGPSDVTAVELGQVVETETPAEVDSTSAADAGAVEPETAGEDAFAQGEGVAESPDADSGSVELPRVNDSKAAWVEWAKANGWVGDADEVTKAYFIETYGE